MPLDETDLSLIDEVVGQSIRAPRVNTVATQDANPDQAARAIQLAPQAGLPSAVIADDLVGIERQVRTKQNLQLVEDNPQIARLAADPQKAAAISDDYSGLDNITKSLQLMTGAPDPGTQEKVQATIEESPFLSGVKSGFQHQAYARRAAAYQAGLIDASGLRESEDVFAREQRYRGFDTLLHKLGGFIGSTASSAEAGAAVGAAAGAAGAVAGPAGAVTGATLGFTTGFLGDFFVSGSGELYRRTDLMRDSSGRAMPETVKQSVALAGGALTGAMAALGGGVLGRATSRLIGDAVSEAVVKPGVVAAINRGAGAIAEAGIAGGALNTAIQLSQSVAEQTARIVSPGDFQNVLNNPEERKRFVSDLATSFADGAMLFGGLRTVPFGINFLRDRATVLETQLEGQQRDSTLGAMQVNKTLQRAPDLVAEYIDSHGVPPISITAEALALAREKDSNLFKDIPGFDAELAKQLPLGGDVEIGAGKFWTSLQDRWEVYEALKEDIRGESGLTLREAAEFDKNPPDYSSTIYQPSFEMPEGAQEPRPPMVLSAEHAIGTQRRALWLDPIITPDAAGLTKADFARVSKNLQDVQAAALKKAHDIADIEIRRVESKRWKADLVDETVKVREELERRPDILAYQYLMDELKDSVWKLDKNAVDALANRADMATAERFRKTGERFSDQLPEKAFGPEGVNPEMAADFFGFASAKEMLDQLVKLEADRREGGLSPARHFEEMFKAEASRRLEERHGPLNERIMAQAIEEALSVKQIDVLVDELKALGANEQVTGEAVVSAMRDRFADLNWQQATKFEKFQRFVAKHGEAAWRQREDPQASFMSKQRQLMNFVLAWESRQFVRETARIGELIDKYSKNKIVEGVDQAFTDRIQQILGAMDRPIPRSENNLIQGLGRRSFSEFIADVRDQTGREIIDAPWLHDPTGLSKYEHLDVSQFRDLAKTLESLEEIGRVVNKVEVQGKLEKTTVVLDDMYKNLDKIAEDKATFGNVVLDKVLGTRKDARRKDVIGLTMGVGRYIDAKLIKIEQLFDWFDHRDPLGPFNTYIYRPLKEAQHAVTDMITAVGKQLRAAPVDKAWQKSLLDRLENTDLLDPQTMKPLRMDRESLLAIMLNMGNEGNFRKLTKGYDWDPAVVQDFVKRNASKMDWDYVQHVWNVNKSIWPTVMRKVKAITGVAPEEIPAQRLKTEFGTYSGGYYPLIRDPLSGPTAKDTLGPFDRPYFNVFTSSSATKERTGAIYPLDLTISRYPGVLRELIHDIHYREPVAQAAQFLRDRELRQGIDAAFGPEYSALLEPWLRSVANDALSADPNGWGTFYRWMREARANMVTTLIGFRPSTAGIHGGAAALNSVAEFVRSTPGETGRSLKDFFNASLDIYAQSLPNMRQTFRTAMTESPELRNRMHNWDRDLRIQMETAIGKSPIRAKAAMAGSALIGSLDFGSAIMVFEAKKRQELAAGRSLQDAIYIADKAVRNAHGSSGALDLAAVARGTEVEKWFTTFYGYWNHNYNRNRDMMRLASEGEYFQVAMRTLGYLIGPAIIHEAIRGHRKEDDSWAKTATLGLLGQVGGGIPFARDIITAGTQGRDPSAGPLGEGYKSLKRPFDDLFKATMKGKDTPWASDALQAMGWIYGAMPFVGHGIPGLALSGLTTKYGSGLTQFLWDHPHSYEVDVKRLLLEGNYHPRKH